jgi:hypothetical protein
MVQEDVHQLCTAMLRNQYKRLSSVQATWKQVVCRYFIQPHRQNFCGQKRILVFSTHPTVRTRCRKYLHAHDPCLRGIWAQYAHKQVDTHKLHLPSLCDVFNQLEKRYVVDLALANSSFCVMQHASSQLGLGLRSTIAVCLT